MTTITALVSNYVDLLPVADRLKALEEIQLFGSVWLPQLADEFPDKDFSAAVVELASFAVLPDDFCDYITTVNVAAAARAVRSEGGRS